MEANAAAALPLAETFRSIGLHYPTVEIPESDVARSSMKWETSIVAQFSNVNQPALPFSVIKARLLDGYWHGDNHYRRFTYPIWSFVQSKVEAFGLGSRLFLFRFSDESDLHRVMMGAPYNIDGRLLLLQRWKRGIDPVTHNVTAAPIWLYMIRLPIEFWNEASMSQVAGPVGPIVKSSYPSLLFPDGGELGLGPKVLVEVDFGKELVMGTNVQLQDGRSLFVVFGYEHKARVCVRCGGAGVGIRYALCPLNGEPFVFAPPVPAAAGPFVHPLVAAQHEEEEDDDDDDDYGEASGEEDDHSSTSSVHNA